jgi:hypothetical protein
MTEFPDDDQQDEDPELMQRDEDERTARLQIDPNGWISGSINRYKANVAQIDMGVTTGYDVLSYENDTVFKDGELAELQHDLEEKYKMAIGAVVDLRVAERAIRERLKALRDKDMRAQLTAHKILDAEDVTVQDIFPSESKPDDK